MDCRNGGSQARSNIFFMLKCDWQLPRTKTVCNHSTNTHSLQDLVVADRTKPGPPTNQDVKFQPWVYKKKKKNVCGSPVREAYTAVTPAPGVVTGNLSAHVLLFFFSLFVFNVLFPPPETNSSPKLNINHLLLSYVVVPVTPRCGCHV